jgi:hypothetical protein
MRFLVFLADNHSAQRRMTHLFFSLIACLPHFLVWFRLAPSHLLSTEYAPPHAWKLAFILFLLARFWSQVLFPVPKAENHTLCFNGH